MDIEKALLDQNLVLGRIEGTVNAVKELQTAANGRTGKLEDRVRDLEKANDDRIRALETSKSEMDGRIQAVQWIWAIVIALVGISVTIILHYWK